MKHATNDLIQGIVQTAQQQEDSIDRLTIFLWPVSKHYFLSEDEIQFDFPAANQKWTTQVLMKNPLARNGWL